MNNKTNEGRVILISDLFGILIQRLWILILIPVIVVSGLYIYNKQTFVPQYESTATLYILKQESDSNTLLSSSDFTLALNVVKDCTYFLKSHSVVDKVISTLELDMEYEDLSKSIKTANPSDTRFLTVTVTASSPQLAKEIVDEICEVGAVDISETMGFQQVNVYERGIIESDPSNVVGLTTYLFIAIAVFAVIYAIYLIIFILDDKIKSEEDVTKYLGLSVIGQIPNIDSVTSKGKKYGGRYCRYGKYSTYTSDASNRASEKKSAK